MFKKLGQITNLLRNANVVFKLLGCWKGWRLKNLNLILVDMSMRIPRVPEDDAYDVLRYMIAGSGFDNVDMSAWNDDRRYKDDIINNFLTKLGTFQITFQIQIELDTLLRNLTPLKTN